MIKFLKSLFTKQKPPKVYFVEYMELGVGLPFYFGNMELTKVNDHQALCSTTKTLVPFDGHLIVQVKL